ncbi:hypothetical protein HOY80DRAFT_192850 [Tuber brumale]|nr:hypothetical protein HOY80DRAFT_192850 [Tuber brumale]
MGKGFSRARKRAYVEYEEEQLRGSRTDCPSGLLTSEPGSSDDSPLRICTDGKWAKYLTENGLIDASDLGRLPSPFRLGSQRLREYRKSMAKLVMDFKIEVITDFDLDAVCRASAKRQPAEKKEKLYEEKNEPTLRVLDSRNTIIRDGTAKGLDGLGEVLAVKLQTTGIPGCERPILPGRLRQSVEQGLFRYLASNPACTADNNRHKNSNAPGDRSRSGGPPAPVPHGGSSKCHHLHLYTAAQYDAKISGIKLARGPRTTWNTTRDTGKALHQFLDTMKPLSGLVEAMFRAVVPEIWDIYHKVYRALPVHKTTTAYKESFGIWTSRAIVLNTLTDVHVDLKDVCRGFCAIVPFGKFTGGNEKYYTSVHTSFRTMLDTGKDFGLVLCILHTR